MEPKPRGGTLGEFLVRVYERYGPLASRQYSYQAETARKIDTSRGKKKPFDYVNHVLVELRESEILPWGAVLDVSREFNPPESEGIEDARDHLRAAASVFFNLCKASIPRWHTQAKLPVIVTEKEGLISYFEYVTKNSEVPVYAIKGQAGKSHLHEVFLPWLKKVREAGKEPSISYLGDCDDYGIEIQKTLERTLEKWGLPISIERLALTSEQVEEQNLSRFEVKTKPYTLYGKYLDFKCEIEAMNPENLRNLIQGVIASHFDPSAERKRVRLEERLNRALKRKAGELTKRWPAYLKGE